LADGLHPNDEGYKVMFRLIMNELGLAVSVSCDV
jgi:lysophospholipase L1-like esterase